MHIVYPSDFFSAKKPDGFFRAEADTFARAGITHSVVDTDNLENSELAPTPESTVTLLYRGWMLNRESYEQLSAVVEQSGARLLVDPATYLRTHHIPNWCDVLKDLTPETVVLPLDSDFEAELKSLAWPSYFVKDYVKSLKTSLGSRISEPGQIGALVKEMEKFRGEIEGGLCVRGIEDFEPDSEIRYFVVNGAAYSQSGEAPDIVSEVSARIDSPFFSVDVARRSDGADRVVEIGDGQVSDPVGWSLDRFVEVVTTVG